MTLVYSKLERVNKEWYIFIQWNNIEQQNKALLLYVLTWITLTNIKLREKEKHIGIILSK